MSKTQAELIDRALQKLGVLGAGQTAETEDSDLLEAEIQPLMSDLSERNIYQWGDPDDIDDAAFLHLADLLSNSVARDYGKQQDEQLRVTAESRLRLLEPLVLSGQPLRAEYY